MANRELEIILKLKDEASKELKTFNTQIHANEDAFKQMGIVAGVALGAIALAVNKAVGAFSEAEEAQNRLAHITKTSVGATNAQVKALIDQSKALENLGVVSSTNIQIAQGQLATFDLQTSSIQALIPSILDYAVAEKGAAVSADELKSMTNGLAQALQGNFASLTKVGFVLDEHTKDLIANGTEAERVAALVGVLNSTYNGMNEATRATATGGMVALQNSIDNLWESLGEALIPAINKAVSVLTPLVEKVIKLVEENGDLIVAIGIVVTAFFSLMAVVSSTALAIIGLNSALGVLMVQLGIILAPITAVVAALSALAYLVYKDLNYQTEQATEEHERFGETMADAADRLQFLREKTSASSGEMKTLADESKKASEAVADLQKTIQKATEAHQESVRDNNMSVANAILDQQKKVGEMETDLEQKKKDLKKAIKESESQDEKRRLQTAISELEDGLERERAALERASVYKRTLGAELDEAERFRNLTQFEQKLETLAKEKAEEQKAFNERIATLNKEMAIKQAALDTAKANEKKYYEQRAVDRENDLKEIQNIHKQVEAEQKRHVEALRAIDSNKTGLQRAIGGVKNFVGNVFGVNDAIISPKGDIITTHPDDYLIATKNPGSLGGGGVVVNVYGDVSGQELVEKVMDALSLDIKRQLRLT